MNNTETRERQQTVHAPIMMGLTRIVVAPQIAIYKVPGVYVEEIPSGVNG